MFTVRELSKLAGVTPRTLRYYDAIGLLKPSRVGANRYRYYGEEGLIRLQQILFYRELDMPLAEIKKIMGRRDFNVMKALEGHKQELSRRITRLEHLLRTVDGTILHLKGKKEMSKKQMFEAFSEEKQKRIEKIAMKRYDPSIVKASGEKWRAYTPAEKQRILDEGNQVYADIVAAMPKGASSPEVQAIVERWRKHMDYFWTPSLDQLIGLAEMYNASPDFKANFDKIHPNLAAFMREAVKIYVERLKLGVRR